MANSQHVNWTPHVTLKYSNPDEPVPDAVEPRTVKFTHVTVKRGNDMTHIPLGSEDNQDSLGTEEGAGQLSVL